MDEVFERLISNDPTLTGFELPRRHYSKFEAQLIGSMIKHNKFIRQVDLPSSSETSISKCEMLDILEGVAANKGITSLKIVNVTGAETNRMACAILETMDHLEELHLLIDSHWGFDMLNPKFPITRISLEYYWNMKTTEMLELMLELPNLNRLSLWSDVLHPLAEQHLKAIVPRLRHLKLSFDRNPTSDLLMFILTQSHLSHLYLHPSYRHDHHPIRDSESILEALAGNTTLEEFQDFGFVYATNNVDVVIKIIERNTTLRSLMLCLEPTPEERQRIMAALIVNSTLYSFVCMRANGHMNTDVLTDIGERNELNDSIRDRTLVEWLLPVM